MRPGTQQFKLGPASSGRLRRPSRTPLLQRLASAAARQDEEGPPATPEKFRPGQVGSALLARVPPSELLFSLGVWNNTRCRLAAGSEKAAFLPLSPSQGRPRSQALREDTRILVNRAGPARGRLLLCHQSSAGAAHWLVSLRGPEYRCVSPSGGGPCGDERPLGFPQPS